jgi:hypothetical protein
MAGKQKDQLTVMAAAILIVVVIATVSANTTAAVHLVRPHKASCINQRLTAFVLVVRPAKCIVASSPSASFSQAANLTAIRWSSWGGMRAVGRGYELGFHLPYSHIPVRVELTRPTFVEELGIYVYKHFRVTSRYGTLSGTVQAG